MPTSFTQESRCPNEYSSDAGSQCSSNPSNGIVWNMNGTGLIRRDIPYPVFYLPDAHIDEIEKIEKCYKRYNLDRHNQNGRPLCSVQLNSFMFAAVSSAVCLRRSAMSALTPTKFCDPLGDQNVYYSLFPRGKKVEKPTKPVTLVTARIDSASLFDGVAPGAASSVVGMVSLIMTAATLAKMVPVSDASLYDSNVLWTLFNGEAFDYIGSQRVAFDLRNEVWPPLAPLSPKDVKLHVELGQIGGSLQSYSMDTAWPLYAYAADKFTEVTKFFDEYSQNAKDYNMTISLEITKNLPPSSLHSFRRELQNETQSGDLPEILLVDYKDTFTNAYYQSVLDDEENIGFIYHNITIGPNGEFVSTDELLANGTMIEFEVQVKMSRLATVLARTLYQRLTGKPYVGDISASAHLADEMLYCFLTSQACKLLLAADYATSSEGMPKPQAPSLYVGVTSWPNTPAVFAGHLLALLAGTHMPLNRTACDALDQPGYSHYWLRGWNHSGVCIQTTMNFTLATSPAFVIPDYDMSSGMYSTWTESVWATISARVFVSAGGGGARVAAIAGVATTILATVLTYWLRKHANTLFGQTSAGAVVNDAASGILRTVNC
ncbi:nicastrin isoform X2 [Battus philenor]|uniref:nicastrin isoform X2 n=1 Tax=Battus philenor TaxID=42288 RepID=UPI0035CE9F42